MAPPATTGVHEPKNRTSFIMLGALLGAFGAHNFYAGYNKKAAIQLSITVLTLGFGSPMSWMWAVIDICTVDRDGRGVQSNSSRRKGATMEYFVKRGEQRFGPYSLSDLQQYVQSGNLVIEDLAQSEGMTDWVPVSQILGNIPALAIGGGGVRPSSPPSRSWFRCRRICTGPSC